MGPEGEAKDGFAKPGCKCLACEHTNTVMVAAGYASQEDYEEVWQGNHDHRNWERDLLAHQEQMAGVPENEMTYQ